MLLSLQMYLNCGELFGKILQNLATTLAPLYKLFKQGIKWQRGLKEELLR